MRAGGCAPQADPHPPSASFSASLDEAFSDHIMQGLGPPRSTRKADISTALSPVPPSIFQQPHGMTLCFILPQRVLENVENAGRMAKWSMGRKGPKAPCAWLATACRAPWELGKKVAQELPKEGMKGLRLVHEGERLAYEPVIVHLPCYLLYQPLALGDLESLGTHS